MTTSVLAGQTAASRSDQALSSTDRGRPIKVLLAKPGLDGHDQGAKVVVQAMKAAGFDVTYTGLRQTPEAVTKAALDTGADVIALSSMAGSHLAFCAKLKPLLEQAGLGSKVWMIGGNIPRQDHDALRAMGFSGVFQTGSKLDEITAFVENAVQQSAASSTGQAS
ncbi:cobalamin B12-binding domain-containing protein [Rhodoferax sp.]|uniref:cobalamin B12-binding domain-containing protein n=1 Tax=Rhodoferax sp. TaxID=50421 RepID=UPI0027582B55|nr:cobalamin-dependent protein [Rhodoferax sp.]